MNLGKPQLQAVLRINNMIYKYSCIDIFGIK